MLFKTLRRLTAWRLALPLVLAAATGHAGNLLSDAKDPALSPSTVLPVDQHGAKGTAEEKADDTAEHCNGKCQDKHDEKHDEKHHEKHHEKHEKKDGNNSEIREKNCSDRKEQKNHQSSQLSQLNHDVISDDDEEGEDDDDGEEEEELIQ